MALIELCGPPNAVPDACAERVLTAGGMRVAIRTMRQWIQAQSFGTADSASAAAALMARLRIVRVELKTAAPELEDEEADEILKVLSDGFAGPVLYHVSVAVACINALASLAKPTRGFANSKTSRAASATDMITLALSKMLPRHAASTALACACANALKAFAGSCGDDDAPGLCALHAGALPLLESMLPAVEAELAGSGVDKAHRKLLGTLPEFVRTLLDLKARREAVLAELLAGDKAEPARRAKSSKTTTAKAKHSPQNKASSEAGAAEQVPSQPAGVDQAAAALDAVSIADAAPTAAAEPAPPVDATPMTPAAPEPVAAIPPPLPQWLLQAVQRPTVPPPPPPAAPPPGAPRPPPPPAATPPPPPAVPPPAAPAAPRGAWAQRPRAIAVGQQPPPAAPLQGRQPAAPPVELPSWTLPPPSPPSKPPAGAWGRGRPAISGLSAGEVPRELECAICLDAAAEGRTPCCGQTAFCAPCAAALTGECPLCRAAPGGASG